jgi:hypothetical protein
MTEDAQSRRCSAWPASDDKEASLDDDALMEDAGTDDEDEGGDGGEGKDGYESSFVTDDEGDEGDEGVVAGELRRLREARGDIRLLVRAYLLDSSSPACAAHPRVEARVRGMAAAAAGTGWTPAFAAAVWSEGVGFARVEAAAEASEPRLPEGQGHCAACGRLRRLGKALVMPGWRRCDVGLVCAARALVAHTLLRARGVCHGALALAPARLLGERAMQATDAMMALLDAAHDAAALGPDDEGRAAELIDRTHALQQRLAQR